MDQPNIAAGRAIGAELIAVVVAVNAGQPGVLTVEAGRMLPSGPFASGHRSLQAGLRAWVEAQTHHPLGYLEQLYTFADRGRAPGNDGADVPTISISYLALTRQVDGPGGASWRGWYAYFPWEDQREADPAGPAPFAAGLGRWAEAAPTPALRQERRQRAAITFGSDGHPWNDELVLQRYELLYEAGLVPEATRDGGTDEPASTAGLPMAFDHRRILATGVARLRAKIKYRPLVFELMPPAFTLLGLQRCVEGISGHPVHKQNFRRLVEQQALVEETGEATADTGGRPAKLFRFRRALLAERAVAGTKPPLARG